MPAADTVLRALTGSTGLALLPVALAATRLVPVVFLAPTFGGRLLPAPLRLAFALGLALLVAGGSPAAMPGGVHLVVAFAREAMIGTVLGLVAAIPFEIARSGGHVIDTVRGATLVTALVPTRAAQASATGDLLYLLLLATVTGLGGDRLLVHALARGFEILPAGAPVVASAATLSATRVLGLTAGLVDCAVALAAPAVAASLLADLLLGAVGRLAPELPLFFLGLPAKAGIGLLVVGLGAAVVLGRLVGEAQAVPQAATALARALAGAPS